MSITAPKSKIKSLRQSEPDFYIDDGFVRYPRAMLHVSPECPAHIRHHIIWAMSEGYLKCVAHMVDYEYTMDKLKEVE